LPHAVQPTTASLLDPPRARPAKRLDPPRARPAKGLDPPRARPAKGRAPPSTSGRDSRGRAANPAWAAGAFTLAGHEIPPGQSARASWQAARSRRAAFLDPQTAVLIGHSRPYLPLVPFCHSSLSATPDAPTRRAMESPAFGQYGRRLEHATRDAGTATDLGVSRQQHPPWPPRETDQSCAFQGTGACFPARSAGRVTPRSVPAAGGFMQPAAGAERRAPRPAGG
jgi:hypothetical protein